MSDIESLLEMIRNSAKEGELSDLLENPSVGVAIELGQAKNVSSEILDKLINHPSISVRHEVAKNYNTSVETLKILSDDLDMLVRDSARITLSRKLT